MLCVSCMVNGNNSCFLTIVSHVMYSFYKTFIALSNGVFSLHEVHLFARV